MSTSLSSRRDRRDEDRQVVTLRCTAGEDDFFGQRLTTEATSAPCSSNAFLGRLAVCVGSASALPYSYAMNRSTSSATRGSTGDVRCSRGRQGAGYASPSAVEAEPSDVLGTVMIEA